MRLPARLLGSLTAFGLLVAPLLGAAPAARASTPAFGGVVLNPFEAALVADLNGARAQAGLPRLVVAGGTTELARSWAAHLSAVGSLSHNPGLLTGLESHGSPNWTFAAENVGSGPASTAATVFTAYMNSPEHRANILAPRARYVGVGAYPGRNGLEFNTMDFVDSYSGALALTAAPSAPRTTIRAVSVATRVDPFRGVRQYATMGGSSAGRPYLAPTTLGTVLRFTARAGRSGGVALIVHPRLNLSHATKLTVRIAALARGRRAVVVDVIIGTATWRRTLGAVTVVPQTRWLSVPVPAADRAASVETVLYLPARSLAAAGGSALVSLGPILG